MIDKEKQIKKSIFKRFTACFLATFSALLFIFYLGYYCGSVYAETEVDYPYMHYEGYQNMITNSSFNKENEFVYFYSKNNVDEDTVQYGFFYFDLQDTPVQINGDEVIFGGTSDKDIKTFFFQQGTNNGILPDTINVNQVSYFSKLKINFKTKECNIYRLVNGQEKPWVFSNITDENGSPYSMFNFYTNIEELDDSIRLEVTFNPALEGVVDRSFISDGQTYYKKSLDMVVKNKSNFNIQYSLGIFPASCTTFDPKQAVFIYFRPDMVYSIDLTNEINFLNEKANLMSKNTDVHWLAPGEANYQTFNYSQLPLEQNTQYRVMAIACKTPYMYGSEVSINGYEDIYEDLYQINWDSYELVYDKVFSIGYLKDVPYDYNDKSNAVVPYKNYDDYQSNQYSYWEYTDENGELQAGHNNLWTDKNSFIHNPSDFGGYGDRVNSDNYTDLFTNQATGFFGFLQSALLFMPPEINALMTFTVIAVCFVIILKFVRG